LSYIGSILISLFLIGFLLIAVGIVLKVHLNKFRSQNIKDGITLEGMARRKTLSPFLNFLSGNIRSRRYRFSQKVISRSETEMTVQALYLLKLVSVITVTVIALLVSFTNTDVVKLSIMSRPQEGFQIFQDSSIQDYSRNVALYKAVVGRIGEDTLKKLDSTRKLEEIEKVLPSLMGIGEREIIKEKAASIAKTFEMVSQLNPLNLRVIILILSSYWFPEFVLFIKRLLLGNRYRKEVIKLENIFELLGSIRNFKTIDIIEEMAKASKSYRKHLENCRELFKTEKEQALVVLKASVKNSRFSRLVDILRVYSMTDKKLALQIMERNRLEKEEEILLTAEEDIDLVDLIAFISIVPILLQLANLLLKPILDMIYEAFRFI
jgi:hypothetical protein